MPHPQRQQGNQEFLAAALAWLRLRLRQHAEALVARPALLPTTRPGLFARLRRWLFGPNSEALMPVVPPVSAEELSRAAAAMEAAAEGTPPPPLLVLARRFELSAFERSLLLLCAAMELDTRLPALCAAAQDPPLPYPTLALAFALFDEPAWDVRSPRRPLFYWRLVEADVVAPQPLNSARLHADPRIVNFIKGLNNYLDERFEPFLTLLPPPAQALPASQQATADALADAWRQAPAALPLIELLGPDGASKRLVAGEAARALGLQLYLLPAELLPAQSAELESLARLCQREPVLRPIAFYLDAHDWDRAGAPEAQSLPLRRFLERTRQRRVFLDVREPWPAASRPTLLYEVRKPAPAEQYAAWQAVLGPDHEGFARHLTGQFSLGLDAIHEIGQSTAARPAEERPRHVWLACLAQAARRFEGLAERVEPRATWDDIVLSEAQRWLLGQVVAQVRQRLTVYDAWGFRRTMSRGLGISALFHGESGTGKTMAAEVIAGELGLYLCRIDLSGVVSKYIGETEKNLRRVFDSAEDGGCVLCFDEADALFGKRSEVKDSHDRYANIEVNYLLQRMESFGGLAVLTTNMRSALDPAFVRRLRFMVPFGFPGPAERAQIWRKALPAAVPVSGEGLDFDWLARHPLTGASVKSVALAGCFLAAEAGEPLSMTHLLDALRTELLKLGQPVREADLRWQPREVKAG
jgi:hypothetical protein